MTTEFATRYGFDRADVGLANWRQAPFSHWAFQNVAEVVPTAWRAAAVMKHEEPGADPAILTQSFTVQGQRASLADHLAASATDLFTIMRGGEFLADWSAPYADPARPHLVFSITKSLTALVAGALEAQGLLSPEDPVTRFVPEAAQSAFGNATLRHLLDMTVQLQFDEAYLDPDSPFARYRRAMLWNPGNDGENLRQFLCTIPGQDCAHGGSFRYRSPVSDMLGVVVERAGGARLADLLDRLIWQKIGAQGPLGLTVDAIGTPRAAGGGLLAARDLARVGEMMRQGGMAPGGRVLPEAWVRDTVENGDRGDWERGDFPELLPGGAYRNQWYRAASGWFGAIGIHGQWLAVDPASETVLVKFSSQAEPVDDDQDQRNIALFEAIFQHFS
ncbi:serine hydrolase [Xinfangfangia sp. CPCC 101601]|uniref:Serine hydrolase n=1 Tax=Pseudogemmobacter lacusdianii TaxID=3069608 RepID=A0ABU0VZA2_9RHOB|nr:serine hydrolase [Xinfangfangia sp. CPCC 101601]MDQ2067034.1 serine hydrolase [Xinfangfangia sp. CPCC 101601]